MLDVRGSKVVVASLRGVSRRAGPGRSRKERRRGWKISQNRNGVVTSYTYDAADRLTGQQVAGAYGTYTMDSVGNITVKHQEGSSPMTMTYDAASRLTVVVQDSLRSTYTYDANGNRASKTSGGVTETYVIDDADKLTSITVGGSAVKTYGYDTAGRTTSVTTSAGTTSLTYDYESRITQITYPSSAMNTFTYNGLDTRVGKVDSAGTATYKRDGDYVTAPVLDDGFAKFTPGVSERRGSTSRFNHPDRMGSVLRQTGVAQGSAASRQYDAFGNVFGSSGTFVGPFGFAGNWGYQSDADSGLQLLGHRYYDPTTGRFLTRDPIKDGRNWYAYVENNPLKAVDPEGLVGLEWTWDGYVNGLITAGHAIASGMTFGIYDGGDHRDDPGFRESQISGGIAGAAIGAAGMLYAVEVNVVFITYKNTGGIGAVLTKGGQWTKWRLDVHPWDLKKGGPRAPWWKWPHYHRPPFKFDRNGRPVPGEGAGHHRPWQHGF